MSEVTVDTESPPVRQIPTYRALARVLAQQTGCNDHWRPRVDEHLKRIMDSAPSGSGIDSGTKLDDRSTPEKIVFNVGYHHMNDGGYYDGWTEHQIIITPSLCFGMSMRITGPNRNDIKDYLGQVYEYWLSADRPEFE